MVMFLEDDWLQNSKRLSVSLFSSGDGDCIGSGNVITWLGFRPL